MKPPEVQAEPIGDKSSESIDEEGDVEMNDALNPY